MFMQAAVGNTAGFIVAAAVVMLLAWTAGRNGRRAAPARRWVPAVVTATYRQAETACGLLRRERIDCCLIPAAEQFDPAFTPGDMIVLVSANRRERARKIVQAAR